jgi:hypothetical protein
MAFVLVAGGMAVVRKFCQEKDTAVGGVTRSEKPRDLFDQDVERGSCGWEEKAGLGIAEMPQVSGRVTLLFVNS